METRYVIKRNGKWEPFDKVRLERALKRSFEAAGEHPDKALLASFVDGVTQDAFLMMKDRAPKVEFLQDLLERKLMNEGCYRVAKGYILYREERRRVREERHRQILQRANVGDLTMIKRNGETVPLELEKIQRTLERTSWDIADPVDLDGLLEQILREVYSGIDSSGLEKAMIMAAVGCIERDPAYDKLAARLFLQRLYREVFGVSTDASGLEDAYRKAFIQGIHFGIERGIYDPRLGAFDLETLADALDVDNDELFRYQGLETLAERYFVRIEEKITETPQAFWMRTAMGLALEEDNKEARAVEFYKVYSHLRFISSTPTLFHGGLKYPQLSSCYVSKVDDDLNHIFKIFSDNAQLSKWSGGIGNDWTAVRATGALIKSTRVKSQGVIPFLKIANDTTVAINRSGKRRGATAAYLETWHYDIEEFLDLRRNTGDERRRTHDMNTACWIPDLFMKRVAQNASWTLFSPNEVPDLHEIYGSAFENRYLHYEKEVAAGNIALFKTIPAANLWKKMITRLFETGHPWLTFKDPCNIRSPQDHAGVVHNSNLCTEITLNNSAEETAVCNLGSVNLSCHTGPEGLDDKKLADTIKTALRMLDNVVDLNFYPTKEARDSNQRHRPVALGVMGLQDALFIQRLPFSSPGAQEFIDRTMESISYHAILSSSELAAERGAYESYSGSKWDRGLFPLDTLDILEAQRGIPVEVNRTSTLDWSPVREHVRKYGMRNSNTMAIAPTATISNIAGCFPCIEPIYKNLYVKANLSGEFTIVNSYLIKDLKERGLWSPDMLDKLKYYDGNISQIPGIPQDLKELYVEAFDVDPLRLIDLTALRGKWIDQSQSHNVFMKGASGSMLNVIYTTAWRKGLKTTYYLRSLAASQIEKSTLDAKVFGYTQKRDNSSPAPAPAPESPKEVIPPPKTKAPGIPSSLVGGPLADRAPMTRETMPSGLAQLIALGDNSSFDDGELDLEDGRVPASQVNDVCSLLDPDCEACQ